jgi:hypothetical protein
MATKDTAFINDRHSVEWTYAKAVWRAFADDSPVPPRPTYNVWEVRENNARKLVRTPLASVMRVSRNGRVCEAVD